jgi:hypothetical protein
MREVHAQELGFEIIEIKKQPRAKLLVAVCVE